LVPNRDIPPHSASVLNELAAAETLRAFYTSPTSRLRSLKISEALEPLASARVQCHPPGLGGSRPAGIVQRGKGRHVSTELQAGTTDDDVELVAPNAPSAPIPPVSYKTLEEVAAELRVSPRWLRGYVQGRVPFLKVGRSSLRFDKRALAALEDELRVMPSGPFKRPPYRNGAPLPKREGRQSSSDRGLADAFERLKEMAQAKQRRSR
jgi:hypothetical protein